MATTRDRGQNPAVETEVITCMGKRARPRRKAPADVVAEVKSSAIRPRASRLWITLVVTLLAAGSAWHAVGPAPSGKLSIAPGGAKPPATPARFVGAQACAECHQSDYDAWKSSHHAHAMEPATSGSVRGN